jgi:hypothetical protein
MLQVKSQGKIVEKIVRTKTGEYVLAVFLVEDFGGEFKVRVISVKPIEKLAGAIEKVKCLSGCSLKSPAVISYRHKYHSVVSPFFNNLEFFVSQPTRAPSHSN